MGKDDGEEVTGSKGFPDDIGTKERKILISLMLNENFNLGSTWLDVNEELGRQKVKPIYADKLLMAENMEACCNKNIEGKDEQAKISATEKVSQEEDDQNFNATIRWRKEEEQRRAAEKRH